MASQQKSDERERAKDGLQRMQDFDINSLVRDELGIEMNFKEVIEPARRIVTLYKQISLDTLDDLPVQQLNSITSQANADYNRFQEILNFSQKEPSAFEKRNNTIKQISDSYQQTFNQLSTIIAYSTSKSADFKRLESEARAAMQNIMDVGTKTTKQLEDNYKESEKVLTEIRKVAAEQGVTQQAYYFKEEFDYHNEQAEKWKKNTNMLAYVTGAYALLSLLVYKMPYLTPATTYESVQLAVSKVLIFAVISYMLYLSARNFLAHKHNAIVNKHRQNALMTYKALVDASSSTDNKEVILGHASACIFGPQSTGYSQERSSGSPSATSVVELLGKSLRADS